MGWMRWGPEYRRARAYQMLFLEENGAMRDAAKIVLADLGRYCSGYESTAQLESDGRVDPNATLIREGRRTVLMRLHAYLGVDLAKLIEIENDERAIQETNLDT